MTDFKPTEPMAIRRRDEVYEYGGLRFVISSNDYGANLAVFGDAGRGMVELVRFQDYVDDPHYHAPVGGWYAIDREANGEPLAWWIVQLRDNLADWLELSGFAELIPGIDFEAVSANVERLQEAMIRCVPPNYARVPGHGVKRIDWSTDESAFQKRNVELIDIGGLRFEIFFDRDLGATMEVFALTEGKPIGMIRLDDYDENPHYHAPVGTWFGFDRTALGEPLAWFVDQLRNNLAELLVTARVPQMVPEIDIDEVSAHADDLYAAMAARVPRGCVRRPGVGLERVHETGATMVGVDTTETPQPQIYRYAPPDFPEGRGKAVQLLGRTDLAFLAVQRLKATGGETNLHTHARVDGFWFVLSGRVRFYTTDDEVIADLGPMEGIVIPRNYPYWFGAADVESEILQFEANVERQSADRKHDTGRIDIGDRRANQIQRPPRTREDVLDSA